MKSNFSQNTAIVSGAVETGNFTIAANGKAFKILIDGLYSNKIKAIIRELSSNAWDAQVSAGTEDVPFELKLPNMLDPIFYVRDFGTSLSHEDIMGLYTTVFQSTKEDSNLSVGKFGLGSKTPFAYTDSFTVTAFMDGTKRVYGAYINTSGVPSISLIASEDTDQSNGLMVSFAAKDTDYNRFRDEALSVLEHFDVMPIVKGATLHFEQKIVSFEGSNFKIFHHGNTVLAKQGCVAYPIDFNNIPKPWSEKVKSFYQTHMIIDFPIGELDITPSRETLSYDESTINNIVTMLEKIYDEIVSDLDKEYKTTVKTMYQAACFKHRNMLGSIKAIDNYIKNLTFNGKIISLKESITRDSLKKNYNLKASYFDSYKLRKTVKSISFDYNKYDISWTLRDELMIVIENVDQGLKFCSKRILDNLGDYDSVLWVKITNSTTSKQLKAFKKLLGYPDKIFKMENLERIILPKVPKDATPVPKRDKNLMTIGVLEGNWADESFKEVDLSILPKDQKYLFRYRNDYKVGDNKNDYSLSRQIRSILKQDDFEKFIIINSRQLKRVKDLGFKNALSTLKEELLSSLDFKDYVKSEFLKKSINHNIYSYKDYYGNIKYDRETSFKKLLDFLNSCDKDRETDEKFSLLFDLISYDDKRFLLKEFEENNVPAKTLKEYVEDVENAYPMVKYLMNSYHYTIERVEEILDYINLVDRDNLNKEKELN